MEGADLRPDAGESSLNLHEAARVERDDGAGAGALDGFDLGAGHGAGELGELHGEGSAEAAALLGRQHLAQLEAADVGEEAARRAFDAELAEGVAAVVERDYVVE